MKLMVRTYLFALVATVLLYSFQQANKSQAEGTIVSDSRNLEMRSEVSTESSAGSTEEEDTPPKRKSTWKQNRVHDQSGLRRIVHH